MQTSGDVLCEIVKWLSPEGITQFRLTCKQIYENARIETIWINKVNWDKICWFNKLSEQFIRKYNKNVIWFLISHYQSISEEFIDEFADRIHWYTLVHHNEIIPKHLAKKYANRAHKSIFDQLDCRAEPFHESFIEKYYNCVN